MSSPLNNSVRERGRRRGKKKRIREEKNLSKIGTDLLLATAHFAGE
jgi:hypothetical protein